MMYNFVINIYIYFFVSDTSKGIVYRYGKCIMSSQQEKNMQEDAITYSSAMSRLFPRVPEINLLAQHKRKKCTSLF